MPRHSEAPTTQIVAPVTRPAPLLVPPYQMDHSWIETYGPWAVLAGGILEGETVFIAAGYAISQGYLDPLPILLLATAGGTIGDATWYMLGRWQGPAVVRSTPFLRKMQTRAARFMRRWGRAAAFLMRFAYGLRIVLPASVGAARYPAALFLPFNLLGAATFASIYLLLGFFFGEVLGSVLETMRGVELWPFVAIGLLGLIIWAIREWRLFHAQPSGDLLLPPGANGPAQSDPSPAGAGPVPAADHENAR